MNLDRELGLGFCGSGSGGDGKDLKSRRSAISSSHVPLKFWGELGFLSR